AALVLGAAVWLIDAVLDYLTFYESTFLDLLIFNVPRHEIYIRSLIAVFFLGFGVTVSRLYGKLRKAEQEAREEKELLATTLRSIGDGVITVDAGGLVTSMNKAAETLTGWTFIEAAGRDLEEVFHIVNETTRERCENPVRKVLQTGQVVGLANDTLLLARDGTERVLADSGAPIVDDHGGTLGVVLVFRDVTHAKRMEQERDRLFNLSPDIFCVAGFDGYFRQLNPAATRTLGWSTKELMSKPWIDFVHPEDREAALAMAGKLVEGEAVVSFDNRCLCADGSYRRLSWNAQPLTPEERIFAVARDVTAEKSAADALVRSEATLNGIMRAAPAGIGMVCNRVLKWVNTRLADMVGYAEKDLLEQSARMLYPSDEEFAFVGEEKYRQIRSSGTGTVETRFRRKDGAIIHVLLSSTPIDGSDHSLGVIFTALDITERRLSQIAVEEERNRSRKYLDIVGVILIALDREGRVTLINRKGCEILGYEQGEILGRNWFERFIPDSMRSTMMTVFNELVTGLVAPVEYYENTITGRDKEERLIAWRNAVLYDDEGRVTGTLSSGTDITEQRNAEERLRRELEVNAVLAGLYGPLLSPTSRISDISGMVLDAARRLTGGGHGYATEIDPVSGANVGHSLTPMMGRECNIPGERRIEFAPAPDGTYPSLWGRSLNTCEGFFTNVPREHASSRGIPEGHVPVDSFLSVPVMLGDRLVGQIALANAAKGFTERDLDAVERLAAYYALGIDRKRAEKELKEYSELLEDKVEERTRELRAAQEELVRNERLAVLGRLTATVSHELRNPLGTIRAAVFSIGEAVEQGRTSRVDRAVQLAERSIIRCDRIIEELLDFTRARELNLSRTDLDRWVQEAMAEFRIAEGIDVVVVVNSGAKILIDADRLRRSLVNVVTNSLQAMQESPGGEKRLTVETRKEGDVAEIRVTDTGPGMTEEVLGRVLEPLFSTKGFGVGLGLPIVKNIMEQHAGGIKVLSPPGGGVTVTLWLPAAS
ncbi:MAG: PAS domain S-box protein, partial [Pseudomonadota bacterium]